MNAGGPLTTAQLDEIDESNKRLMDEAVEFAKSGAVPEPSELYTNVYVPDEKASQ